MRILFCGSTFPDADRMCAGSIRMVIDPTGKFLCQPNQGRIAARRIALQVLALVLFGTAAMAEVPTKGNLFFGYSYSRAGLGHGRVDLNGWNVSLDGRFFLGWACWPTSVAITAQRIFRRCASLQARVHFHRSSMLERICTVSCSVPAYLVPWVGLPLLRRL
jgi:hypothetical protein